MNEQTIIDAVEEPIEAVASAVVETIEVVRHDPLVIAGAAIIGLSIGAAVGYNLAKRYLEPKYSKLADEEIAQAKLLYAHINKDGFESPTVAVEKLIPDDEPSAQAALRKYQGQDVHLTVVEDGVLVSAQKAEAPAQPTRKNVFDEDDEDGPINDAPEYPGWDYENELARRTDNRPYIVTKDEYFENEPNFDCVSVTYYEGDEVLADDSDGIIDDIEGNVGFDNLKKFGHGSGEKHIVYVFNKKSKMGFEVARSEGRYAVEVLGFGDEDITERMPRRGRRLGD